MRDILFREKIDSGEWIYGYYFYDNQNEKGYITTPIKLSEDGKRR